MQFFFLPLLKTAASGVWTFLSSTLGQFVLVFVVAWLWSGHRASERCAERESKAKAAIEAAYREETARQAEAAQEIGAAATARAEEDAATERALRRQIEAFDRQEPANAPLLPRLPRTLPNTAPAPVACLVDPDFAGVVRQLDRHGSAAKASRAPSRFRKAR